MRKVVISAGFSDITPFSQILRELVGSFSLTAVYLEVPIEKQPKNLLIADLIVLKISGKHGVTSPFSFIKMIIKAGIQAPILICSPLSLGEIQAKASIPRLAERASHLHIPATHEGMKAAISEILLEK